jgi:hypothetical protein
VSDDDLEILGYVFIGALILAAGIYLGYEDARASPNSPSMLSIWKGWWALILPVVFVVSLLGSSGLLDLPDNVHVKICNMQWVDPHWGVLVVCAGTLVAGVVKCFRHQPDAFGIMGFGALATVASLAGFGLCALGRSPQKEL